MAKILFFNDIFISNNKISNTLKSYLDFEIYSSNREIDINSYSCLVGLGSGCFDLFLTLENNNFQKDVFLISCYLDFNRYLSWTLEADKKTLIEKLEINADDLNEKLNLEALKNKRYFIDRKNFKNRFHLIYSLDNKLFDTEDALKIADLLEYPRIHVFEEGGFAPFLKFPEYISNLILKESNQ